MVGTILVFIFEGMSDEITLLTQLLATNAEHY